jgi:DNA-directed RNA polymerase beta' subunit
VKPENRGKEEFKNKDNFIIETDGTALLQVLAIQGVDATRTTSNSLVEIL